MLISLSSFVTAWFRLNLPRPSRPLFDRAIGLLLLLLAAFFICLYLRFSKISCKWPWLIMLSIESPLSIFLPKVCSDLLLD